MEWRKKLTTRARYVVGLAGVVAGENKLGQSDPLYLLYAMLLLHKSTAAHILARLGVDRDLLEATAKIEIMTSNGLGKKKGALNVGADQSNSNAPIIFDDLYDSKFGQAIGTENILLGIASSGSVAGQILSDAGATSEVIKNEITRIVGMPELA